MTAVLDYTGKSVVITGGTGGIGLGLARGFAEAGATVVASLLAKPRLTCGKRRGVVSACWTCG